MRRRKGTGTFSTGTFSLDRRRMLSIGILLPIGLPASSRSSHEAPSRSCSYIQRRAAGLKVAVIRLSIEFRAFAPCGASCTYVPPGCVTRTRRNGRCVECSWPSLA